MHQIPIVDRLNFHDSLKDIMQVIQTKVDYEKFFPM